MTAGTWAEFYDPEGQRFGIPTYPYHFAPDGLMTRRQFRAEGLRPGGQDVKAQILWRHRRTRRVAYLYEVAAAKPKRDPTPAQQAAIAKALAARRTCPTCGEEKDFCIPAHSASAGPAPRPPETRTRKPVTERPKHADPPHRTHASRPDRKATGMTPYLVNRVEPGTSRSLPERVKDRRQRLSDRVHRLGDAYAHAHGWTVTPTTGRLGMGARTYHDPRFGSGGLVPSSAAGDANARAAGRTAREPGHQPRPEAAA